MSSHAADRATAVSSRSDYGGSESFVSGVLESQFKLNKKRPHESVDYVAHRQTKNPHHISDNMGSVSILEPTLTQILQGQTLKSSVSPTLDPMIVPQSSPKPAEFSKGSSSLSVEKPEFLPLSGTNFTVGVMGRSIISEPGNGKFTTYTLQIRQTEPDVRTWSVRRRYRHFVDFRTRLRRCGVKNLRALPPKTWTGNNFDSVFLEKRQIALDGWLRTIPSIFNMGMNVPNLGTANKQNIIGVIRSFLITLDSGKYMVGKLNSDGNTYHMKCLECDAYAGHTRRVSIDSRHGLSHQSNRNTTARQKDESYLSPTTTLPIAAVTLSNFELLKVLGKGSYGKVILVRKKSGHDAGTLYAMKVLKKTHVMKKKQVAHTRTERSVLGSIRHPFIVRLHYAFQTGEKLHFVLDYCSGGELFFHLQKHGRFPPKLALFYTAELALALGELHKHGIVYRDMKPENILLDHLGHVQLADFGLSKEGIKSGEKGTRSFCGTPEYLAPEVLDRKGHGFAVDWWALGALLYEMITGLPPWYSRDRQKMFASIRTAPLQFPSYIVGELKALIAALLVRDPRNRLGGHGSDVDEIKDHPIFRNVNWVALLRRETKPPWKPPARSIPTSSKNSYDVSNFEQTFTNLPVQSLGSSFNDSLGRSVRGESATNGAFEGFTYVDECVLMEENFKDRLNLVVGTSDQT